MNPADLTTSEQALLVRMREMGGWLSTPLDRKERDVMGDLVRYRLAEYIPSGPPRYALTGTGEALAEEIANSR